MEKMRQWSVLTAISVLVVLVAGWQFVVSPQRSKAAALRTQTTAQQQTNVGLQSQVSQLEEQKKGLPAQQKLLNQFAEKIPDNPGLPALIRDLSAAAQGAGVELVSLAPSPPVLVAAPVAPVVPSATTSAATTGGTAPVKRGISAPTSPLAAIPIVVTVQGSFFNIQSFFAAVEKLQRAMLVTQFTVAPGASTTSTASTGSTGSSKTATAPDTLLGTLTASVFESPSAAPTVPSAPVAAKQ
jgi:Tfp pilus assembly protein PilO